MINSISMILHLSIDIVYQVNWKKKLNQKIASLKKENSFIQFLKILFFHENQVWKIRNSTSDKFHARSLGQKQTPFAGCTSLLSFFYVKNKKCVVVVFESFYTYKCTIQRAHTASSKALKEKTKKKQKVGGEEVGCLIVRETRRTSDSGPFVTLNSKIYIPQKLRVFFTYVMYT